MLGIENSISSYVICLYVSPYLQIFPNILTLRLIKLPESLLPFVPSRRTAAFYCTYIQHQVLLFTIFTVWLTSEDSLVKMLSEAVPVRDVFVFSGGWLMAFLLKLFPLPFGNILLSVCFVKSWNTFWFPPWHFHLVGSTMFQSKVNSLSVAM